MKNHLFAINRLKHGLKYGSDMITSKDVCIEDAISLLQEDINNFDKLQSSLDKMVNLFEQDHRDCTEWVQYKQAKQALKESGE